jgi:glycogen debranching enzyme
MDDYLRSSGDADFVRANWDHVWRAYQFLRSTWDARGLPQNVGVGHGWVEGGPLLPVKTEFYQSGLGVQALAAMAELARAAGKNDIAADNERLFQQRRAQLNNLFWSPDQRFFAFAINQQDGLVSATSGL